jgi:hypothetical protein
MAIPLLGRPWYPRVPGMEGASSTVARSLCSFVVVQWLDSWTLMLDSFGTDGVMSCVAGPVCFMLGALAVCVFGTGDGAGVWFVFFFFYIFFLFGTFSYFIKEPLVGFSLHVLRSLG